MMDITGQPVAFQEPSPGRRAKYWKQLSTLQRAILSFASHRRAFPGPLSDGVDAYYSEILANLFGWTDSRGPSALNGAGKRFDPSSIDRGEYRAVRNALSRACLRLESRGLVEIRRGGSQRWSGVRITDTGLRIANPESWEWFAEARRVTPEDMGRRIAALEGKVDANRC